MTKTTKFVLATAVAALFFANSCNKACDAGYEGTKCDTKMNAKFVGTYNVADTALLTLTGQGPQTQVFTYSMGVTASSSDPKAVSLTNFGGFGAGSIVSGTVDGTNLTIPTTTLGNEVITNGVGTINGTTLSFSYTATDSTGTSSDHAVGTR